MIQVMTRFGVSGLIVLVLSCQCIGQEQSTDSEIERWIEMLEADSYSDREQASKGLMKAGPDAFPAMLDAWASLSSMEGRVRGKQVLESIIPEIDFKLQPRHLESLRSLRSSQDPLLSGLAVRFIGSDPDPQLASELKSAIEKVLSGEKQTVPVSEDLLTKIQNAAAFKVVRSPPLRESDQQSPWRTIQDSNAHQEILLYRVKWFGGGGHWSGWMLSGVNDLNEKLNRQHWNCFYDHQHEYIKILTKVGKLSKRNDYLMVDQQEEGSADSEQNDRTNSSE